MIPISLTAIDVEHFHRRFKKSKRFNKTVDLINQVYTTQLARVLTRVLQKLPRKVRILHLTSVVFCLPHRPACYEQCTEAQSTGKLSALFTPPTAERRLSVCSPRLSWCNCASCLDYLMRNSHYCYQPARISLRRARTAQTHL